MAGPEASYDARPASGLQPSAESVFKSLANYAFGSDPDYLDGLAAILGHPDLPVAPEEEAAQSETILQARCFYFARKFNLSPIDPAAYASWLVAYPTCQGSSTHLSAIPADSTATQTLATSAADTFTPPPQSDRVPEQSSTASPTDPPQPPYPTSFSEIMDLILHDKPVPGIKEIPTTILEPGSSKIDKTPQRRKPWEKEPEMQDPEGMQATGEPKLDTPPDSDGPPKEAETIDVNAHKETGTGVVNILKPNAVPDSGLLSKD